MEILRKRRSCRKFIRDEPVSKADLEKILEAARHYPCARGVQDLEFCVITNRQKLDELGDRVFQDCGEFQNYLRQRQAKYGFREPNWCDAPCVIFANFLQDPEQKSEINCGCAIMSIIVAAEELGYATLPVLMASGPPQNKGPSEILGVPSNRLGLSVAIGKAHPDWKADPKKTISQIHWIE
jgi:nitroreductase